MGKLAFLFPGQASQYCGMGRDLATNFPESKAVFDAADSALAFSITQTCFEGSEEALKLTENTQPANLNSPEQTVISGSAAAVKRAVEIASQSGAKRAVILPVSAPFHCALMMPAHQRLGHDLRAATFP